MPTILTPQGWVKVAPTPRKRAAINHDPAAAFRGPLAYFSCQPSKVASNGTKSKGLAAAFPYDLSASPEKLKRHGEMNARRDNRAVSAPVHRVDYDDEDDEDDEEQSSSESSSPSMRSASPPPQVHGKLKSKSQSKSSSRHHSHHHGDEDNKSTSSSNSSKSYTRQRPLEATHHTSVYPNSYHNHTHSPTRAYHQQNHHQYALPAPPTTARSMSYSWYNATTPLNLG